MIYLLIIQWKQHFSDFSIFLVCTYKSKYLVVATILPIGPHYVTLFQPNQAWNRWILHKLCWLVLWIIIFGQYICYLFALACTLTEKMFMLLYRNGLLIEHNLVEVNGQNVVGLKVSKIIHELKEKPCYLINANKNSYC